MKRILTGLSMLFFLNAYSQNLKDEQAKIDIASSELKNASESFNKCLVTGNLDLCVIDLSNFGTDPYKKFVIAGILFDVSPQNALKLCKEAYAANPEEVNFTRELAMCYHKNLNYKSAVPLYEKYFAAETADKRVYAWLADCYINLGEIAKASEAWSKLDYTNNHTSTDFAIYSIYGGESEQLRKRDNYRKAVIKGDANAAYNLIFLDLNWQKDWWNTVAQEAFQEEDLKLVEKLLAKNAKDIKFLKDYAALKLQRNEGKAKVIKLLKDHNLMIEGKPLVANGNIQSDLLRICLQDSIIDSDSFYKNRGKEILDLAKRNKDVEMLNVYAHLQATVEGKVDPAIDKLGWKQFKDERFVVSYFLGKAENNRYDDPELAEALLDIPDSANLQWIKVNCAYIEKKNFREELIKLIQKEFRSLKTDKSRYANALNGYFFMLAGEK